ncbi:MAG: hypothetical protein ACRDP7_30260 [Trebonia sp.]
MPTDVLVAAEWIATIPGFSREMTGERLPPDVLPSAPGKRIRPAPWLKTGFVTVQWAGGGNDPDVPRRNPVMQVDCWAALPGSNDPPWRMCEALGEAIWLATRARTGFNRPLSIQAEGVTYPVAVVQGASLDTSFRRLYDDAADYAHTWANLALSWVMPSLTIP